MVEKNGRGFEENLFWLGADNWRSKEDRKWEELREKYSRRTKPESYSHCVEFGKSNGVVVCRGYIIYDEWKVIQQGLVDRFGHSFDLKLFHNEKVTFFCRNTNGSNRVGNICICRLKGNVIMVLQGWFPSRAMLSWCYEDGFHQSKAEKNGWLVRVDGMTFEGGWMSVTNYIYKNFLICID